MPVITTLVRCVPGLFLAAVAASAACAQPVDPEYPTTEFADGSDTASVTVGSLTATIVMERRPRIDPDFDSPVLTVTVDGAPVLEIVGVAAGFDFPATEASIAEIDPENDGPEILFTSYSGGAHCCTQTIVAAEADGRWVAVPIGEFDGDGGYLRDANGDGVAEIVTYDNRFLYEFDCYACSAAPLLIVTVRGGKAYDASADQRYLANHREWLEQLEEGIEPDEQWKSPGFLAGWVAAKIRAGEGDDAWKQLSDNWNFAADRGEEVCLVDKAIDDCPKLSRATLTFPERLKLFLERTHYLP
ncbi:hypothetical protein [Bauldia litoralis]|uniref:VCBS repeat-containing protein n=1 Tax=Bauldia litoralis TaxID=665467 RepID=A0A1G6CTH2_9HYPH|nr:hypothetical protein [Bauldia litoralis]SDB36104.1 hypothetical protein SAMN02982931_02721 [Bauldia litoralis]